MMYFAWSNGAVLKAMNLRGPWLSSIKKSCLDPRIGAQSLLQSRRLNASLPAAWGPFKGKSWHLPWNRWHMWMGPPQTWCCPIAMRRAKSLKSEPRLVVSLSAARYIFYHMWEIPFHEAIFLIQRRVSTWVASRWEVSNLYQLPSSAPGRGELPRAKCQKISEFGIQTHS